MALTVIHAEQEPEKERNFTIVRKPAPQHKKEENKLVINPPKVTHLETQLVIKTPEKEAADAPQVKEPGMTQTDFYNTWGYLKALQDILDGKAREAEQRKDDIGSIVAADYRKQAAEIQALQEKILAAAERAPE